MDSNLCNIRKYKSLEYLIIPFLCAYILILPFPHTVAIRLSLLFLSLIIFIFLFEKKMCFDIPFKNPLLFWAVLPIALLPFSIDYAYSLGEYKNDIIYTLISAYLFFYMSKDVKFVKYILLTITVSSSIISIWGVSDAIMNNWYWVEDWSGKTLHPQGRASFVTYTLTVLPLSIVLLKLYPKQHPLIFAWALLLISSSIISEQRIFLIGLIAEVLIIAILLKKKSKYKINKRILFFIFLLTIFLGIENLIHRYGSLSSAISITLDDVRITQFIISIKHILSQPITGSGFGRNMMSMAFREDNPNQLLHAHNLVLDYGIQLGFLGIISILWLFFSLAKQYLVFSRSDNSLISVIGAVGLAIVIGVFIRNQVNTMFFRDLSLLFWSINGLLIGLTMNLLRSDKSATKATDKD